MGATRLGIRAGDRSVAGAGSVAARLDAELVELVPGDASLGELFDALREGRADAVVAPAIPGATALAGLALGAVPKRRDARDALVGSATLDKLPAGSRVTVGTPLRRALAAAARPELSIELDSPTAPDAVIDALAVLEAPDSAAEFLDVSDWPTAPGQGAVLVVTRRGDEKRVAKADHRPSHLTVLAELGVLERLGAEVGETLAAHASLDDGLLFLSARVYRADGSAFLTSSHALYPEDSSDPTGELAARVADELLALGAEGFAHGGAE